MAQRYNDDHSSQVRIASGLNLLIGLWLIISPWILGYPEDAQSALWNGVIVGAAIATIAAIRLFVSTTAGWLSWINVAIGLWLAASPWILGNSDVGEVLWNDVIVGAAVAVLGAWSALATESQ